MRNLRNVYLAETQWQGELPLTATAWDTSSDSLICTFGPSHETPIIDLRRKRRDAWLSNREDTFERIASWDASCPLPDLPCDSVVSLQHFADSLTTCLVLEGGDIVVVREEPFPGQDKIEIMGTVDVGITAAAWSPDEELLAVSSRASTLLYMTREFEPIAQISLGPDDLSASHHVSVGWGKRETQFQGKRAKALRDPTVPEKIDEGKLSGLEDRRTTISWRGDGAYVAINSVHEDVRRVIRVYSREGVLDSASEPVDGLEGALSWRPYGNLIAGVQRFDDRVDVVFFERNGLRHGQFSLRLTEEDRRSWASSTIQLNWNIDSTILAVRFRERLQLWTMGNYHYYLKQEIPIAVKESSLSFAWHPEKPLTFAVGNEGMNPGSVVESLQSVLTFFFFFLSDSILEEDYVSDICHGSTLVRGEIGAVAVIDGSMYS